MIRQAISCDICGTEKKQTNHWFVAQHQGGELRVSGWDSRNRLRPGSKHLCGQTCLHKLVDDFMAKALAVRSQPDAADSEPMESLPETDASLTSHAAYAEFESSARLITPAAQIGVRPEPARPRVELVAAPPRLQAPDTAEAPLDEPPRYGTRNWRAEAWDRERERERGMRTDKRRPSIVARRVSGR